jgi:NADH dehydrogenase FAD-containing subunit
MSGHSQQKREESIDIRALKKQGMGTVYQGKVIKINPREKLVTLLQTRERKY